MVDKDLINYRKNYISQKSIISGGFGYSIGLDFFVMCPSVLGSIKGSTK